MTLSKRAVVVAVLAVALLAICRVDAEGEAKSGRNAPAAAAAGPVIQKVVAAAAAAAAAPVANQVVDVDKQQKQPQQQQEQPQQQQQQQQQQPKQHNNEAVELKKTRLDWATLVHAKECESDINHYCPKALQSEMKDISVLKCIHNQVRDLSTLDKKCQNIMYETKKNLTTDAELYEMADTFCKDDIEYIDECKEDTTPGHLAPCLLRNQDKLSSDGCKKFVTNIGPLVFSDYRLIAHFIADCQDDISRHQCGRLDTADNGDALSEQGRTVECLSFKFRELDLACKKQILRVAELQSNDFHMDRALFFACRDDRERFCEKVNSGKGRVYKCLAKHKFDPMMSKPCTEQLTRRQLMSGDDARVDGTFYSACKKDLMANECRRELRNHNNSDHLQLAGVILCLESAMMAGKQIEPECKEEVFEHRKMFMSDWKLSVDVAAGCATEINAHCEGGVERDGKTIHCLLKHLKESKKSSGKLVGEFSTVCANQLVKLLKVANAAEDVRIDRSLVEACQNLLDGPCRNIQPGQGRVVQCLLSQLNSDAVTEQCEERILEIQFFVSRNWDLNPTVYKACHDDAVAHCSAKGAWNEWSTNVDNGPLVLPCLFHRISDSDTKYNISSACTFQIKKLMSDRAKSIDMVPEVQERCAEELAGLCSMGNLNEKGEEFRCLQRHLKNLGDECRAAVTQFTKDEREDMSLDKILLASCMPIINEYCSDKRDKGSDFLNCLIEQKNNDKMDAKCRMGIEHHQLLNLQDVDFNPAFKQACRAELGEHCTQAKSKSAALTCLSDIQLRDTLLDKDHRIGAACREQLRFELFQQNENIYLDPELADACREDIGSLCRGIKSGRGQVLECLRGQARALRPECQARLFKRDKLNMLQQDADFTLHKKCRNSIQMYCSQNDDVIACLRKHLLKPDLEPVCRVVVINRIMMQNKDVRLNPSMWKACRRDVTFYCKNEFTDLYDPSEDLHGRVIKCLKHEFVKNTLSKRCEIEVDQVIREAANVDARLDPFLAENCNEQLQKLCGDEPGDKQEDCLRLNFQRGAIDASSKCYGEVKRIILEGAADVFVDNELVKECSSDLARYCSDVPPGSSQQLKCLLGAKTNKKNKFSHTCAETLEHRQELWKLAGVYDSVNGLEDLARLIVQSEHSSYFLFSLSMIVLGFLCLGCGCRRFLFREHRKKT